MTEPPELLPFQGDWRTYEDEIYQAFVQSFVEAELRFRGWPVRAQYRPATRAKGFSFWHVISEAPHRENRNEDDRIPDLRRCERILWIPWLIANAGGEQIPWWENRRGRNTHVVIWAREHDFAVVLAKRRGYYVLRTAYAELKPHRQATFEAEWAARNEHQKG